ncbi:CRAL TRIO domain protein [Seminavis robusta]|uniref:CRAL TRIO domain protein n=1 Tax=Seminavis robusta TaxID=568900 RepID=A0A9N8EAF4_9STRA|nr:CRAL TRIO domain protein [Seminavis robusta]|eukprot:Sro880_g215150.1 CRAL TRIO domain protein (105) ;mRNA; r:39562-39965
MDLEGVSLVKHYSRAAFKRDGKIMDKMQNCYPQMVEVVYLCNSPDWMHLIWALVKHIVPQRVLEKVKMIAPQNADEREQLHKYMSEDMIPVEIGGPNQTPPSDW